MDRRNLLMGMAALAAAVGVGSAEEGSLGKSRVLASDLKKMPSGSERWLVFEGTLGTGEAVSVHESVVPAGTAAGQAHRIQHSELIFVIEGTLEYVHDGETEKAAAGSVIYVAYGTDHAVRNMGSGPVRYFVVQMGGDTKKD